MEHRTRNRRKSYGLWRDGKTEIPQQTCCNWRKKKAQASAAETNVDPISTPDSEAVPVIVTPGPAPESESDLAVESDELASESDSQS